MTRRRRDGIRNRWGCVDAPLRLFIVNLNTNDTDKDSKTGFGSDIKTETSGLTVPLILPLTIVLED